MTYYAIIGDIKESKKIEERASAQEKLYKTLKEVNATYKEQIAANFLITLGDEFQGLLHHSTKLLDIIKYIQREMYPIEIRFGIGIGEIYTEIDREAAIGADGPAFYAARNVLQKIHEQERKLKRQAADIQIAYYDRTDFSLTQINMMLSLIKVIEDSWYEKQRYTIWDMMSHQDNQSMCAERMNTTQSAVAKRLSEGKYLVYKTSLDTISEAITRLEDKV